MLQACGEGDADDVSTEGEGWEKGFFDVESHGGGHGEVEQCPASPHDDDRAAPLLVIEIVEDDGGDQKGGDSRNGTKAGGERGSGEQEHHGHTPHGREIHPPARDGPLAAVLVVEELGKPEGRS